MFCLPQFPPQRLGFDLAIPEPSISSFFNLLGTFEGICFKQTCITSQLVFGPDASETLFGQFGGRFYAPIRPNLVLDV